MNNIQNQSAVYGWRDCPEPFRRLISETVKYYRKILDSNLIGFYLHGSLAMDCFNPLVSDVDFLVVVEKRLTIEQKKAIIDYLLKQYKNSPAKGMEMSIVREEYLKHFVYPTPFELHYSNDWYEKYKNGKVDYSKQNYDEDLAAHFVITKNRGICLFGKPIKEVFPVIPKESYTQSLLNEANWIYERSEEYPIYTVLNLCRILAFLKDNKITSKKEGGEWALLNLPRKYSSLINYALACYSSASGNQQLNIDALKNFVEYTKGEINSSKKE